MKLSRKTLSFLLVIISLVLLNLAGVNSGEVSKILSNFESDYAGSVLESTTSLEGENLVIRVIDGDTIEIEGKILVRYIGIDTPETVDPRKTVQCFGKEAADANKKLVLGKMVHLEKDVSETDRYGRLLRYVYVDNVMINQELVKSGYAQARSYPPDIKYQELLLKAEESARSLEKGLWSGCGNDS